MRAPVRLPMTACATALFLSSFLSSCATLSEEALLDMPVVDRSGDMVIAADGDGVGVSWASVTESPLVRTATELSNLGGAPIVLGAVGVMMAADAAPRGRARRLSLGLNAEIDADALDADLAGRIAAALDADMVDIPPAELSEDDPAVIRIKGFDRAADLRNEGYVVETEYALALDGSALRVTAEIRHAELLEVEADLRREMDALDNAQNSAAARSALRKIRRLQERHAALQALYRARIEYHSDPVDLPMEAVPAPMLADEVRAALDTERQMRRQAAQDAYDTALATADDDRRKARVERRRDRALARADKLFEDGLARVGDMEDQETDDPVGKMDRLLLAMTEWQAGEDGRTRLDAALDGAHAFIAEAVRMTYGPELELGEQDTGRLGEPVADGVETPGSEMPGSETPGSGTPTEFAGVRLLNRLEDGRSIMLITEGPDTGTIMSIPRGGPRDYGRSVAQP
ncbi:MAG: hypothetical protein WBG08_02565 [Litorimonas sp.]